MLMPPRAKRSTCMKFLKSRLFLPELLLNNKPVKRLSCKPSYKKLRAEHSPHKPHQNLYQQSLAIRQVQVRQVQKVRPPAAVVCPHGISGIQRVM